MPPPQSYLTLHLPSYGLSQEALSHLGPDGVWSQALTWPDDPNGVNAGATDGIAVELASETDIFDADGIPNIDSLNIGESAASADDVPMLNMAELRNESGLDGQRRRAVIRYSNAKERMVFVEIIASDEDRVAAIDEMLKRVAIEVLNSDKCNICLDSYVAITASQLSHGKSRMPKCGHAFGRSCIAQWLKENNTCPMCREKMELPVAYKLRIWVDNSIES